MKYHFAHNSEGIVVPVQALTESDRGHAFICPGCRASMLARMGQRVAWHFAHRPGTECNPETYLHKLGKQLFFNAYREQLQKGLPFWIEYYQRACQNGGRCGARTLTRFDLTRYFPVIGLEQGVEGFIPDVVLGTCNGRSGAQAEVFVEIKVTHACSAEKLASGKRIIEIHLQSEGDLAGIQTAQLRETWRVSLLGSSPSYPTRAEGGDIRFYHFERQGTNHAACGCHRRRMRASIMPSDFKGGQA